MNGLHILRITIHSIATIGLCIGLILCSIALIRPRWQEADFPQLQEYHYHGLWEDCIKGSSMTVESMICNLKVYGKRRTPKTVYDLDVMRREELLERSDHHKAESWRLTTLVLISVACLFCIFSLIVAFILSCAWCMCKSKAMTCRVTAVLWLVLQFIAVLCGVSGMIVFARNSFDVENRVILEVTNHVEQHWGESFYHCLFGIIAMGGSFLVSIIAVVLHFVLSHKDYTYARVPKDMVNRHGELLHPTRL